MDIAIPKEPTASWEWGHGLGCRIMVWEWKILLVYEAVLEYLPQKSELFSDGKRGNCWKLNKCFFPGFSHTGLW